MRVQHLQRTFLNRVQTLCLYILRWFMNLWVRSELFGVEQLEGLDPNSIQYVFRSRSLTDLLVYDGHAEKHHLLSPLRKNFVLGPKGMLRSRSKRGIPKALRLILNNAIKENSKDVILVPISVFWGRDPGREEKSLFHLLFFDDEYGGWLQRLVMFFVQGQRVSCHIGSPLSVQKALQEENRSSQETGRKLRRLLRIQFKKQRNFSLGPQLYDRQQLIRDVVMAPEIQKMIQEDGKNESQRRKMHIKAEKHADEIAAKPTQSIIRFCSVLLEKLWARMYDDVMIRGLQNLRPYAEKHTLIFMPCHRSHVDYLMLGQMIYQAGLTPPHTAAGKNLDFWPIGGLLRRAGAFYIRRTFAGQKLYTSIFRQYLSYLIRKGFPLMFFPEGGRSRTGKLLSPKTGMLSMVLQSAKDADRSLALVPVYINYDRLFEGRSFAAERRGRRKKVESIWQLFHAFKLIGARAGHAYFHYGEPLLINNHGSYESDDIKKIAKNMMIKVNQAALLTPMAHVSTLLLSSDGDALDEVQILDLIEISMRMLVKIHGENIQCDYKSAQDILNIALTFGGVKRFTHPTGAVVYVDSQEADVLQYYRNNTLHLYAAPSLIAAFFMHNDIIQKDELCACVSKVIEIVGQELFLEKMTKEQVSAAVQVMVDENLLHQNHDEIHRSYVLSSEFSDLSVFARLMKPEIEIFSHMCLFLSQELKSGGLSLQSFEVSCLKMLHRQSLLSGSRELIESKILKSSLLALETAKGVEIRDGHLYAGSEIKEAVSSFFLLVNQGFREKLKTPL
ncbi:MAG: 1-acyl-sn-glycerol-3-phosphate acyltransferase [Oligoflexales bacterium]